MADAISKALVLNGSQTLVAWLAVHHFATVILMEL